MTAVEIRDARGEDHETFLRLFTELGTDDPLPDYERWAKQIQPTMMLAERGGEVAGYAHYRVLDGTVHLAHLVTAPGARRSGVGRALIAETKARAKTCGATHVTLNVKPTNRAAVALYSSVGMTAVARSFAMRLPWAAVERQPAPFLAAVRDVAPEEDRAMESRHGFAAGRVSGARAFSDRMFRAIDPSTFGVFDVGFGGVHPFAFESLPHAVSLLRAFRPYARPDHDSVLVNVEDDEAHAQGLIAAGATLRFETTKMSVAI